MINISMQTRDDDIERNTMFTFDEELSVATHPRMSEVRIYNLDKVDLTVEKILKVGSVVKDAMLLLKFNGSEDYADFFDSVGTLLQYASNQMLIEAYGGDEEQDMGWDDNQMIQVHASLVCIEQFNLIGMLKK